MGTHLHRVRSVFGRDTRGLLAGGRYALTHTRTMEFDELRPYVPGDDVRDIDWKASARSGEILLRRFVSEMHHRVLLIADAGLAMTAMARDGERKGDVAHHVLGAIGLVALGRHDQVGMVFGDRRGCVNLPQRRGEHHIEGLLDRYTHHLDHDPGPSDVICQLDYVATHHRHRMLVVVVSDEPDPGEALDDVLGRLTARHDLLWAMVPDLPAVAATQGYDVTSGARVTTAAAAEQRVVAAYQRAELERAQRLSDLLTDRGIGHALVPGTGSLRRAIVELTGAGPRAR